MEGHTRPAAVLHFADFFERSKRLAARKALAIKTAVARDLDFDVVRERVDDRNADAMQAAGGFVDLGVELAACVQHRHDDFERGFVLEFRMRIDRHAATIIRDRQIAVFVEIDIDEIGVTGNGLVHGIIDDFGEQMMQRALVGAANIHARTAANRLQPFQHLDVGGIVIAAGFRRRACGFDRRGRDRLGNLIRTCWFTRRLPFAGGFYDR